MMLGRLSPPLVLLPLTLCCLPKTYKALDESGEDERLPGSFLLPNSATDKLLSASCRVTLTGYTNGPAYAGGKTTRARILFSSSVGYAFLPSLVFASRALLDTPVYLSSLVGKLLGIPCVRRLPMSILMICRCVFASRSLVSLPGSPCIDCDWN